MNSCYGNKADLGEKRKFKTWIEAYVYFTADCMKTCQSAATAQMVWCVSGP